MDLNEDPIFLIALRSIFLTAWCAIDYLLALLALIPGELKIFFFFGGLTFVLGNIASLSYPSSTGCYSGEVDDYLAFES